jgi:homogentisate 1,2-dioxygenase
MYTPKRYRNYFGQLLEHSPFCERDIRRPKKLETHDEKGDFFVIKVKKQEHVARVGVRHTPLRCGGLGRLQLPLRLQHPRLRADHRPRTPAAARAPDLRDRCLRGVQLLPAPVRLPPAGHPRAYNHSNIDSDEVLYYVDGDFMSRNDIGPGHISLHPAGIPHGPHPGAMERSIGKKVTDDELAVMVDTFKPLMVTEECFEDR